MEKKPCWVASHIILLGEDAEVNWRADRCVVGFEAQLRFYLSGREFCPRRKIFLLGRGRRGFFNPGRNLRDVAWQYVFLFTPLTDGLKRCGTKKLFPNFSKQSCRLIDVGMAELAIYGPDDS